MQTEKDIAIKSPFVETPQLVTFIRNVTQKARRIVIKHKATNCGLAGALKPYRVSPVLVHQLCPVLGNGDLGRFSVIYRIVIDGVVFSSKEYTRPTRTVSYFAIIDDGNGGTVVGSVQRFLYHHRSGRCFAVYKKVNMPEEFLYHKGVSHILKVKDISHQEKVVLANQVREKVMYLNDSLARVPNLHGLCG